MSAQPFPKSKILAVDDNRANLVALDAVLSREYDLVFANSGREAILYLQAHQDPDVILMDVQMPTMDGYEAASIIRALPGCKEIPLIFVSAVFHEEPHIKKGYAAGALDYFSKPFDPEILRLKLGVYASFRQRHAVLKERERQIRESEEVLRAAQKMSAIIENLSVGVIIADPEGRICQTNEEVSRILKASEAFEMDAYGKVLGWWDSDGRLLKDPDGPLAKALHGTPVRNELLPIQGVDGSAILLSVSTSPLQGLDATIVGAVVLVQDVTEHQRVGEDFENRITRLISLGVALEQSHRT